MSLPRVLAQAGSGICARHHGASGPWAQAGHEAGAGWSRTRQSRWFSATMGTMSASDAVPLPRLGEVFFDVRGDSRTLRLSWYADTGVAVLSIWQGGMCTGTFRLAIADLPRMVETLQRGPQRHAGQRDDQHTRPAQYPAEPTAFAAALTEYSAGPVPHPTGPAQYPAEPAPYTAPPAEYPTGPAQYPAEPPAYAAPTSEYSAGPPTYAAPPAEYPTGSAHYPAEPPAYAGPPTEYSAGSAQYPAPPAEYAVPPAEYAVPPADNPAELADPRGAGYLRRQPGLQSEPTQQWESYRSGLEDYRPRLTQYPSEPAGYPQDPAGYLVQPAGYPAGPADYSSGPSGRSHRRAGAADSRYPDRGTDSSPYSRAPAPADYLDEMRPGQYRAGTSASRLGEDLDRTTADYSQHYSTVTDDPRAAPDDLPEESLPYGSPAANRVAPGWPARPGVPFG
jgi:hypothetical protein